MDRKKRWSKLADFVTNFVGSWKFVIFQTLFIIAWVFLNYFGILKLDPYPFLFLTLFLSFQAAYTAPFILMSQKKLGEQDRILAKYNYEVSKMSNDEIKVLLNRMESQNKMILKLIIHLGIHDKESDNTQ
jgi:uncharacterized membrane protein